MGVEYLRVSVTDRCNLRCVYCRGEGDCDYAGLEEILSFEEINRIVRLLAGCGVRRVRLTGGEPLMRRGLAGLVERIAGTEGVEDLSLTTNGVLLEPMAEELKKAGLRRVNIGLSSAEAENYRKVTGYEYLAQVRRGIRKAIEAGLSPVKVNAVIVRGVNEGQIGALAGMSVEVPVAVRFIEYCPTTSATRPAGDYVANSTVRRIIEREYGALTGPVIGYGGGPAYYYKIGRSAGMVGFIDGRSSVFCGRCRRLRLTSDGLIKPCLYWQRSYDMRKLMREGAGDEEIGAVLKRIVDDKHLFTKQNSGASDFCMRKIGG